MKKCKILVFVLAICMMVTSIPINVLAEESLHEEVTSENQETQLEDVEEYDPGEARYRGFIAPDFYAGKPVRSTTYTHDARFTKGYTIRNGIDVSKWNGTVDWNKVKKAGKDFAFIRVGNRLTAPKGDIMVDPMAEKNLKGANAAGIPVGVYIYSQAVNKQEAIEEANFVLQQIKGYKIEMPIMMDIEYSGSYGTEGRLYNAKLTKDQQTANCKAFCDTIRNAGYTPMVYGNKPMLEDHVNGAELSKFCKVWLARYNSYAGYAGDYEMWQYTSDGSVDGISGRVDLSFWYVKEEDQGNVTVESTKLTGKAAGFGTIQFSWDKISDAAGYQIQDVSSSAKTVATITQGTTVSYKLSGLNCSTSYKYRIRAYKTVNGKKVYSAYSDIITVKTSGSVSGIVKGTDVNVRSSASTSAKSLIKVNSGKKLTVTGNSGNWYRISITISGVTKTAYISKDYVTLSSETGSTAVTVGKPTLSGSATSFDRNKLTWTKVSGASGYVLQRHDSSINAYKTVTTITSGNILTYTHIGLNAATTYKYRLRAYKMIDGKKVYGSYSAVKGIKTKASRSAKISATNVNVRTGAGTKYSILKKTSKGTKLTVTGSRGEWYRVSLKVGTKTKTGYVMKKYVKLS